MKKSRFQGRRSLFLLALMLVPHLGCSNTSSEPADVFSLAVNNGPSTTYVEQYTGTGQNGYDPYIRGYESPIPDPTIISIQFTKGDNGSTFEQHLVITVWGTASGTYSVSSSSTAGNASVGYYPNGQVYQTQVGGSVTITRLDDIAGRIQGSFNVTLQEYGAPSTIDLTGTFDVTREQ